MRRAIALAILLCVLLTGCGKSQPDNKKKLTQKESTNNAISNKNTSNDDVSNENFEYELTGDVKETASIEKKESVFIDSQSGGYDAEAKKLRESIQNSKSNIKISGKTYYISSSGDDWNSGTSPEEAWRSVDALLMNDYLLQPGDAVLFERGGIYRLNSSLIISKSDITYGAYGSGDKPCIYGSAKNYADSELWEPSQKKNIWKIEFPLRDAGLLVFNNGEFAGEKKTGLASLNKNGSFYHNSTEKALYLYCDSGNPGDYFKSIEIGTDMRIISIYGGISNITIDNICFKYTGAHAIDAFEKNHDIKITNCEFGWIGGSIQTGVLRYGNAIQFWDTCYNVEVKNNWIYQVYDAGFTFQYALDAKKDGGFYHDITVTNNLIEYCTYSVEIFTSRTVGYLKNIHIDSNVMRFAGMGFGMQRPSRVDESHICGWNAYYGNRVQNLSISNNIFDLSSKQIINWGSKDETHSGFIVKGNSFYQKPIGDNPIMIFSNYGKTYANNQSEFYKSISEFDSSPKVVKWMV